RPARSSTPGMAARLAARPGAGPVLPRPATIRPSLDHWSCALSCHSMSLLDLSKWHGARSFWETRPLMPWTVGHQIQNGSEFPELVAQNFRNPHKLRPIASGWPTTQCSLLALLI